MKLKHYQERAHETLCKYVDHLREEAETANKAKAALEAAGVPVQPALLDFPAQAWEKCRADGLLPLSASIEHADGRLEPVPHSSRTDGTGKPVPSVCLKVPTGGGKTLLGAWGAGAIHQRYLRANHGFVLWIVPNEAIYSQTRKQLVDRDHPYRQTLDRISAAPDRVKILEKDDPLFAADMKDHLVVMLLMLQSANRETKEQLRMFRDRGNVHGFFPSEGDPQAHYDVLTTVPNLDTYGDGRSLGSLIKDSLGNVLRLVRPVVVLDEGHKAYSPLAMDTLYGFNPSFVLELSATPPARANRLVDVSGTDLEREEMIKLPINLEVKAGQDWKKCLLAAWSKLTELQTHASKLQANSARYIRPILLVQVERTGKEQRDPKFVHALDAKEYLGKLGLSEDEIAIKTAEVNDLREDRNQDLLSPANRVRAIITKQALQEGWDCPFAYVLCSLAASHNLNAMTQLVGRVLRQPNAQKTGVSALDECYVYCHHVDTSDVVDGIKASLESDGMGDIAGKIQIGAGSGHKGPAIVRDIRRRKGFETTRIFLPQVLLVQKTKTRELDYETDILSNIDWSKADAEGVADGVSPDAHGEATQRLAIGLNLLTDVDRKALVPRAVADSLAFDVVHATRAVTDIAGNPWVARNLVDRFISRLQARGFTDATIGRASGYILDELCKGLEREQNRMAEEFFKDNVARNVIQFRLRPDKFNWELPKAVPTTQPNNAKLLYRSTDATPVQKSLFSPMYEADFNNLEAEFACYIDDENTLRWWFRNIARQSYGIQGWRKHVVYPDFIFATQKIRDRTRIAIIETKGEHLGGGDTKYKQALLSLLSTAYSTKKHEVKDELKLRVRGSVTVTCDLIYGDDWQTQLHDRHFV